MCHIYTCVTRMHTSVKEGRKDKLPPPPIAPAACPHGRWTRCCAMSSASTSARWRWQTYPSSCRQGLGLRFRRWQTCPGSCRQGFGFRFGRCTRTAREGRGAHLGAGRRREGMRCYRANQHPPTTTTRHMNPAHPCTCFTNPPVALLPPPLSPTGWPVRGAGQGVRPARHGGAGDVPLRTA